MSVRSLLAAALVLLPTAVQAQDYPPHQPPGTRERYPEHEDQEDGTVVVRLRVADTGWLVRRVLELGDEAEVLSPPSCRAAMRSAVA